MQPSEFQLAQRLASEGLTPTRWSNGPHAVYALHDHPYGKILVVVSGRMTLTIDSARPRGPALVTIGAGGAREGRAGGKRVVTMKAGDRLTLPPRTPHSAVVGPEGVVCLEAHITL